METKVLQQEEKNVPYNSMNYFDKVYPSPHPNRQQRRKKESRFRGNNKGNSIIIVQGSKLGGTRKYFKAQQRILLKNGNVKTINHYTE